MIKKHEYMYAFIFQVLKLSGDKILSSRLIIDAMGNFSPIVKQVRSININALSFSQRSFTVIFNVSFTDTTREEARRCLSSRWNLRAWL